MNRYDEYLIVTERVKELEKLFKKDLTRALKIKYRRLIKSGYILHVTHEADNIPALRWSFIHKNKPEGSPVDMWGVISMSAFYNKVALEPVYNNI